VRRGALPELAAHYAAAGAPRGEVAIVVGPPARAAKPITAADLDQLLTEALASQSPSTAATAVAAATGQPRRELYRRALALKGR
jgi:16S rRNA (cytidine1402-2'-O)-methyltransferase